MNLKIRLYGILVGRVPQIREKYQHMRSAPSALRSRPAAWLCLIWWNLLWLSGRRNAGETDSDRRRAGRLPVSGPESALSLQEPPDRLAERLSAFDVISFDVFDTLLLRPFCRPEDLFYIVGQKLSCLDFRRIRMEAQARAAERCRKEKGHGEVTLSEIYDWLEKEAGIPKEEGMRAEQETEEELCFANPYMLEVFRHLKKRGKTVIVLSDMYLPSQTILRLLKTRGFSGIQACLVSCEQGCGKGNGGLYEKAFGRFGPGRFIHVGDNRAADGKKARLAGWESVICPNVNMAGKPFRAGEMSPVTGSLYRGLVNAHLHNGLRLWDQDYECGFVYGGIFVLGYCQFIHDHVRAHGIERILFLARDGHVLSRVYRLLYPDEAEKKARYALWSRLAAVKLTAARNKYDYFRRFLFHKVNQGFTLEQILEAMELSDLLPGLTGTEDEPKEGIKAGKRTAEARAETGLKREETLTDKNVHAVRDYLNLRWEEVLARYAAQLEEGRRYYERILDGASRAALVDIGWAGSGAMALDVLINQVWNLDCEVTGLLAGTNTRHNAEPDMSEAQLAGGKLVSYLFSHAHNRDLWERHSAAAGDNVALEELLASPFPGFRGFTGPDWEQKALCPRTDAQARRAERIQEGILDFCRLYLKSGADRFIVSISGRDAAAPARLWAEAERKRRARENTGCVLV